MAKDREGFDPGFYAFENGVKFPSVAEGAHAMKEMGYAGVGSVHPNVLGSFLKEFDAAGLRVFSIYVGAQVGEGAETEFPAISKAVSQLKGRDALVELFVRKGKATTDAHAVAFVRKVAAEAKEAGLKVVLYPHSGFYVETVDDAVRIAKATGAENIGVAFNLCHFLKVEPESDLRATLDKAGPLLWSVSTCGAEAGGSDWRALIQPLDRGDFDQAGLLRHLREIGYRGDVGLQCYGLKEPSTAHLPKSLDAWKRIRASVAE
ncbi:xylose isomerase domain-containing protein [Haloferula helveola]|uniref:Xylose isomerase domain-containing protein n=2 Tax=Haloferula helveola TaxID=490095 RepID=A0ABN6H9G0_9BACT|nr:xylose isomerase domain-containing protein [Haloferula helveola]